MCVTHKGSRGVIFTATQEVGMMLSLILYMRKVKLEEIKPSIMSTKARGPKRALETYSFVDPAAASCLS